MEYARLIKASPFVLLLLKGSQKCSDVTIATLGKMTNEILLNRRGRGLKAVTEE